MTDPEPRDLQVVLNSVLDQAGDWDAFPCSLGIYTKPTRLFLCGDFALVPIVNGSGRRQKAFGWSTKFGTVIVKYVNYCRYSSLTDEGHENRVKFRLLDILGEPTGTFASFDLASRGFVLETLRAVYAGKPGKHGWPGTLYASEKWM